MYFFYKDVYYPKRPITDYSCDTSSFAFVFVLGQCGKVIKKKDKIRFFKQQKYAIIYNITYILLYKI